jgi:ribosomal protein S27AE
MKMLCVEEVLKEIEDSADKPERDIKEAMYGERLDREAIHCTCPRCGKEADIVKWIGASSLEYNQQVQLEQDRAKAYFMETKTAEAAKAFEDYIQGLHCSRCNTNGAIVVQDNHSYDIACGKCGATLMDSSMYNLEFKGIKIDAIIKHIFK